MRRTSLIFLIVIFLILNTPGQTKTQPRDFEPIVLTGQQIPQLIGRHPQQIAGYKFIKQSNSWIQIPIQIDERKYMDLSIPPGKRKHPAAEYVYVGFSQGILGGRLASDDDPRFDADDELVFMANQAGDKAPNTSAPPQIQSQHRIEIALHANVQTKYIYLFNSPPKRFKNIVYHLLDTKEHATIIETDTYRINFSRRWVLDQIRIKKTAQGSFADLIDRLKFRAYSITPTPTKKRGLFNETEDYWSDGPGDCGFSKSQGCSWYLGHKSGPVRAIRMVQGAASGPTTSYFAFFYPNMFSVKINYRVHPLPDLWFYVDYDSEIPHARFFNQNNQNVSIDGRADAIQPTRVEWGQMSSAAGSMVVVTDVSNFARLSPETTVSSYYRDDIDFNDFTGDDRSAIGNHGVHIQEIPDTDQLNAVVGWIHFYLLPANAANQGEVFAGITDNPVKIEITTK